MPFVDDVQRILSRCLTIAQEMFTTSTPWHAQHPHKQAPAPSHTESEGTLTIMLKVNATLKHAMQLVNQQVLTSFSHPLARQRAIDEISAVLQTPKRAFERPHARSEKCAYTKRSSSCVLLASPPKHGSKAQPCSWLNLGTEISRTRELAAHIFGQFALQNVYGHGHRVAHPFCRAA